MRIYAAGGIALAMASGLAPVQVRAQAQSCPASCEGMSVNGKTFDLSPLLTHGNSGVYQTQGTDGY